MPGFLIGVQIVFENLRYNLKYRRAWVVEIRNPLSDLPIDEQLVPSRRAAMAVIALAQNRLPTLPLDHIGMALRS